MNKPLTFITHKAFTLIELLVVISIIAILAGILLPVVGGVMDNARKTQAKNTEVLVVSAIKSFQTEYDRYPIPTGTSMDGDVCFGINEPTNAELFDILQANKQGVNTEIQQVNSRGIVYMQLPMAKNPKKNIAKNGIGEDHMLYDPWGTIYLIGMDANNDNNVNNPYGKNAGSVPLHTGVIVYSWGKDQQSSSNFFGGAGAGDKNDPTSMDDVISWQ